MTDLTPELRSDLPLLLQRAREAGGSGWHPLPDDVHLTELEWLWVDLRPCGHGDFEWRLRTKPLPAPVPAALLASLTQEAHEDDQG